MKFKDIGIVHAVLRQTWEKEGHFTEGACSKTAINHL